MKGLSSIMPEGKATSSKNMGGKLIPQLELQERQAYLTFELSPANAPVLPLPLKCSIVLLDEKGRVRLEESYTISAINEQLEITLPKLSAGSYNAWIKLQGKAYIRQFTIESKANEGWRMLLRKIGLSF